MNDYDRIENAIRYIVLNELRQPSLDELAQHLSLSSFHLQKMFVRWAGISPKKFMQCLTARKAKECLQRNESVLDTSLNLGLSGPGRLHDLMVLVESASPGEIKKAGAGWTIRIGRAATPFGDCFVAESPRGICRLEFMLDRSDADASNIIQEDWPNAKIEWNHKFAKKIVSKIFHANQKYMKEDESLRCLVRGTKFQLLVWKALLRVPFGQLATYGTIAREIGKPRAYRAVGAAVANNPVAMLIPCHRVIRATGVIGEYRWEQIRKRAIVATELAQASSSDRDTVCAD